MSDTPGNGNDGVLRPFQERATEPLPPVEPSRVVPQDRAPTVPDHITPDDVANESSEPPVEGEVPDIAPGDVFWSGVDDPEAHADDAGAGALPDATPRPAQVTLPRKPFLIGVGVVALVMVVLVALWQTAGSDSSVQAGDADIDNTDSDTDSDGSPAPDTSEPVTGADADPPAGEDTELPARDESAGLRAEIDGLNAQLGSLEEELASQPLPSLPGASIHRIPVAAGSKFVSATDTSVAVVGPFGSYANIDPATNSVTASGNVARGATRVIRTGNSAWITNYADSELVRIDPISNTVVATFELPGPDGLAKFGDALLVASFDGEFLGRVDPATGAILDRVALGGTPTDVLVSEQHGVWVALFDTGEIVRINVEEMTVSQRVVVGAGPVGLATSARGVWVANHNEGTVALVDTDSAGVVATIEVGEGPTGLIAFDGQLWVTVTDAGELVQIDIGSATAVSRTSLGGPGVGGGPVGISTGAGSLWIAMDREDSVVRITLPE